MESQTITPKRIKPNIKKYMINTLLPILLNGFLIGVSVGVIVWCYNIGAEYILKYSTKIYSLIGQNLYYLPLLLCGLVLLAVIMNYLLKFTPEMAGSGIPYTEGVMRGQLRFKRLKMFFGTIFYSFISFFAGLPLGCEGPSIQLGGVIGDSISHLEKKKIWKAKAWERISITSGASAGLAVAFNAPLTGLVFALEEGHKRFSPMLLLSSASAVIFSVLTCRTLNFVSGMTAEKTGVEGSWIYYMFQGLGDLKSLPVQNIWMLLILGLIIGLFACMFSLLLIHSKKIIERLKIKRIYVLIAAYVVVGIIGVFYLDVLGGGTGLINKLVQTDAQGIFTITWKIALLLLFFKLITITLASSSGSTGGLFVPLLALGALVGAIFGQLFIRWGLDSSCYSMVICLSMTAMMAAVVRAPLTGTILIAELTGQLTNGFLQAAIVVIIAYFIVELFSIKPLYDELLEGTLHRINQNKTFQKVEIEQVIEEGSFAVGRSIRDILWPYGCQIQKIIKVNKEGNVVTRSDMGGERLIRAGDVYVIKIETYDLDNALNELHALVCAEKNSDKQITPLSD